MPGASSESDPPSSSGHFLSAIRYFAAQCSGGPLGFADALLAFTELVTNLAPFLADRPLSYLKDLKREIRGSDCGDSGNGKGLTGRAVKTSWKALISPDLSSVEACSGHPSPARIPIRLGRRIEISFPLRQHCCCMFVPRPLSVGPKSLPLS